MTRQQISFFLLVTFFSLSTLANGSSRTRNGGDVVYCTPANSYELLDHFEARHLSVRTPSGYSAEEVAKNYINANFGLTSPKMADRWIEKIQNFRSITEFIENGKSLPDIDDAHPVNIPANCELKQIAIQTTPVPLGHPKIVIDKFLWDNLPLHQQALLIIHEVVLSDIMNEGIDESSALRYFVGQIAAVNFNNKHSTDHSKIEFFTKELKFNYFEKSGLLIYVGQPKDCNGCQPTQFSFNKKGQIEEISIASPALEIKYDLATFRGVGQSGSANQASIIFDHETEQISLTGLGKSNEYYPFGFSYNMQLEFAGAEQSYLIDSSDYDYAGSKKAAQFTFESNGNISFHKLATVTMHRGAFIHFSLLRCSTANCMTTVSGPDELVGRLLAENLGGHWDGFKK